MSLKTDILQNIPQGKPVRIFLPLLNRADCARIQCLYHKNELPKFSLLFKTGMLPVDDIDSRKPCIISIDMGGSTVSLEAMIAEIVHPQTLEMIARKSISHEQMREFFRVDAVTSVISKSFHNDLFNTTNDPWSIEGETVDISGSGTLAIFDEKPRVERPVRLEITIPSIDSETIKVLAHQVRAQQLRDGRYEVAYHFDDITTEDRDKIIGCCLDIQRKMLRLKVRIEETK